MTAAFPAGLPGLGRRTLWRGVLTVTGGVRIIGELPAGPCVIVANHSSHADTAALLATIPGRRAPVVAAAADYWFGARRRRVVCRWLAGAFPVRRDGGGSTDLAEAAGVLADGRDVIVFPEGTRSRDGRIGDFHTGAARLAASARVPLVPVGIHGTRDLLPVHGRPGRARITVRIGEPTADLAEAKSVVAALATPAGRHRIVRVQTGVDSEWRRRVAAFAESRAGAIAVAAWAFAEALAWPLIPEFLLAIVVVAAPRRAPRLATCAALGSLAGGAAMYLLAGHGIIPPAPLTTPRMHHVVAGQIGAEGASALTHQTWSGIPFKVYGAAAGSAHIGLAPFLFQAAVSRGVRIFGVGLLLGLFGAVTWRLRRWYVVYLVSFLAIFSAGLAGVVTYWSQS
jgi:1-acyl-sn-glycerol-3-phosphate acyltransferase